MLDANGTLELSTDCINLITGLLGSTDLLNFTVSSQHVRLECELFQM